MTKMEIDQMMKHLPSQRAYYARSGSDEILAGVVMAALLIALVLL